MANKHVLDANSTNYNNNEHLLIYRESSADYLSSLVNFLNLLSYAVIYERAAN